MKRLFIFIMCLMCSPMLFAQGGVDFRHLTFDEALARAEAEKKLVFINCYTTRNGACEFMAANIFPQEKAGAFFNPRFVCVKFDMEQGEGKELKTKLGVRAFPAYLIIRPDGTVQHRIVGSSGLDKLIKRVKLGLNEKTSLFYLTRQYEKGKMNKKKLMAYYQALSAAYDRKNAGKIYDELMRDRLTEKDKLKTDFWPLFEDPKCTIGTPDFNFILSNIPVFEKNIGKGKLDVYLYNAYDYALSGYITGRVPENRAALDDLKKQIDRLDVSKKDDLLFQCDLATMVVNRNTADLVSLFEEKAATLTGSNDLWDMISALRTLNGHFSKPELMRIVVAGDKIMANPENSEKNYLGQTFEQYKKRSHVGVYFEDLTFEQALEKAEKQHKMIFMDCYTSWCGPCEYMSDKVFTQEKAGDFLNRFICVKYDMEQGEGPALARRFGVRAYPTFLLVNPDGTVRHKMIGAVDIDKFIKKIEEANDDTKATGVPDVK